MASQAKSKKSKADTADTAKLKRKQPDTASGPDSGLTGGKKNTTTPSQSGAVTGTQAKRARTSTNTATTSGTAGSTGPSGPTSPTRVFLAPATRGQAAGDGTEGVGGLEPRQAGGMLQAPKAAPGGSAFAAAAKLSKVVTGNEPVGGAANAPATSEKVSAKKVAQDISTMRSDLDALTDKLKNTRRVVKDHSTSLAAIQDALVLAESASATAKEVEKSIDELDAKLEAVLGRIGELEKRVVVLEDNGSDGDDESESGQVKKRQPKRERNNAIADAVRACLKSFMNVANFESVPEPLANNEFWVDEKVTIGEKTYDRRTLRPKWEASWPVNQKGWQVDVVDRIQNEGYKYTEYPRAKLEKLSAATVQSHLLSWFRGLARKWKEEKDGKTAEERRKEKREIGRKRSKALARTEIRDQVPGATDARFDHLFVWQYTSTDASGEEEYHPRALDPDTDDDRVDGTVYKVWIARAPAWRSEEGDDLIKLLDRKIAQGRKAIKPSKRGNAYRPRVRREAKGWRDSVLPRIRGTSTPWIKLADVDPAWLADKTHGRKFNNCKFIVDGGTVVRKDSDEDSDSDEDDGNAGASGDGGNDGEAEAGDDGDAAEQSGDGGPAENKGTDEMQVGPSSGSKGKGKGRVVVQSDDDADEYFVD